MQNKDQILSTLTKLKSSYASDGIILLGLFGSYSKDTYHKFSDIDIAYKIDKERFSKNYHGGFAKLLRIDDIRQELQGIFHRPVDLVSNSNKLILKDIIYV
ncbi:MAG: nucleotidyltransferase domain-containing protein [Campylobacteraceae bacterium]|nr:nucleotidyltransferase domain-containing protein [Campylobacteraceae bacterium]